MKAYEIPYDLKTVNNKQAEIHIGIRLAKFVIYFSGNSFCPRPRACLKKAFCTLESPSYAIGIVIYETMY